jgi:hypothetical protein
MAASEGQDLFYKVAQLLTISRPVKKVCKDHGKVEADHLIGGSGSPHWRNLQN